MQSQIREVMHQSHPSTATINSSIPPGHGEPQYLDSQSAYNYHASPMANDGFNGSSMALNGGGPQGSSAKRPSTFKQFSSRFSTASFGGHSSSMADGSGGRYLTEQQRIKKDEMAMHHLQRGWLDRARQHKNFEIIVFSALISAMLLVIFLAAMIWIGLGIIKTHKYAILQANVGIGRTSPR
ncbi:hypothetical protein PYCC9005_002023 [Savitreella phatthalungensis]